MSQKITSKNLTYDNSLPPFLARLRGQATAHSGPDPILAAHRRPGQKRSASEEAEDAPVVVDEAGNVISFPEEDEKPETREENGKSDTNTQNDEESALAQGKEKEKEKVAGIGGSRKRKVGRVIGEQQHSDDEKMRTTKKKNGNVDDDIAKASAEVRNLIGDGGPDPAKALIEKPKEAPQKTVKSTKKKPAKKIKLSFGDDDGE
ncbi:hypothetical protein F5B22DRAFT_434308 [Xylaria bambusicola]|uniref:uncharacterized protein n=1 Tax=Xylaria bambusicola TaxID=326684 RepID=UPI0020086C45|nr:uncharacterized protein F5B22DRAFT_434308 [Xylaria bambusicola]KAI0506718.1 hypothetical protein F5B22DRAFT_434308 [Xylaria bambusicola]